jgi:glycosyltransferase involved in cell wall biosynthesis
MKILHVYPDYGQMGGIERSILLLCQQCQALPDVELPNVESIVACSEGGRFQQALERQGILTIGLQSAACFKNPNLRALDLKAYWQAKQIAANIQPDLVHLHIGGLENLVWRFLGLPTLLTLHGYGSLYSMTGNLSPMKRAIKALLRNFFCWSLQWMNVITCVSWAEADRLSEEGYLPEGKPVHIIPNGLPLAEFQGGIAKNRFLYTPSRLIPEYRTGDPVIAWIGRLEAVKQPELFLALARQLSSSFPNAWWLLVGDGPLQETLEAQLLEAPTSRILMPGFLPADSVLAIASVLVHTPKAEGFGMAVLEAMAAGVPVASFPVGGVPELLQHAPECLAESESLNDLTRTLRHVLSLSAEARNQLSANLIRQACQYYDAERLLPQWLGLYQDILSRAAA